MGQDELGEVGHAEEVHLELVPGVVERDLLDRSVQAEARVVDQYVDAALGIDDPVDDPLVVVALGHVHLDRGDAVVGQVRHAVHPSGGGVDAVTLAGEQDGGLAAHARRRSGYQHNLAHCLSS